MYSQEDLVHLTGQEYAFVFWTLTGHLPKFVPTQGIFPHERRMWASWGSKKL